MRTYEIIPINSFKSSSITQSHTHTASRSFSNEDIEAQGPTQLLRGPMTRAIVRKTEETLKHVVTIILEVVHSVKDIETKLFQCMIIIEDPWAGGCCC